MRTTVAALMIGVMPLVAATTGGARAAGSTGIEVSATVHGVTLTLSLPHDRDPRGALVRATLRIRNRTHSDLAAGVLACRADGPSPTVQVLDALGHVVFPAALPDPPVLKTAECVHALPPAMPAGSVYSRSFYIILRDTRVRGTLVVPGGVSVSTPMLRVHLGPADPPTLRLQRLQVEPLIRADVVGGAHHPGTPLLYTDWSVCGQGAQTYETGQTFTESLPGEGQVPYPTLSGLVMSWTRTGTRILPGCPGLQEWHVAAGWLGHSVGYLQYTHG